MQKWVTIAMEGIFPLAPIIITLKLLEESRLISFLLIFMQNGCSTSIAMIFFFMHLLITISKAIIVP